jgi:uroporphyrinogen decarboxylase
LTARHERVLAALELREPDRIPTFDLMLEYAVSYAILGRKADPMGFFYTNKYTSKLLDLFYPLMKDQYIVDKYLELLPYLGASAAVEMGYDAAWLTYFPVLRFRDSKTVVDLFGRLSDVAVEENGNMTNPVYREGLITGPDAWQAWDKRPLLRLPEKINKVFSRIYKKYGDKLFIFGFSSYGLFENTWQPMGFERFVLATRKERGFLNRMIRFLTDLYCMMLEAMADAGIPGVIYTDDLAYRSGPMLNPRLIEELYGDSYRRISETAHSLGMKIIIHSCGNTTALLEWFADCGFDAVHPLEPTAGMDLAVVKGMVGDRICLVGNLDVSRLLVAADKEEVYKTVRQAIHDAGYGGGYILAPDHSHPGISVERLHWMLEAAGEYGRYPLVV